MWQAVLHWRVQVLKVRKPFPTWPTVSWNLLHFFFSGCFLFLYISRGWGSRNYWRPGRFHLALCFTLVKCNFNCWMAENNNPKLNSWVECPFFLCIKCHIPKRVPGSEGHIFSRICCLLVLWTDWELAGKQDSLLVTKAVNFIGWLRILWFKLEILWR